MACNLVLSAGRDSLKLSICLERKNNKLPTTKIARRIEHSIATPRGNRTCSRLLTGLRRMAMRQANANGISTDDKKRSTKHDITRPQRMTVAFIKKGYFFVSAELLFISGMGLIE
jgi:hypothetical protein